MGVSPSMKMEAIKRQNRGQGVLKWGDTHVTYGSSTCVFSACSNILDIGKHPREYTEALGRNEMAFIRSHAVPRMNSCRSSQNKELPEDGMALLKKYIPVCRDCVEVIAPFRTVGLSLNDRMISKA